MSKQPNIGHVYTYSTPMGVYMPIYTPILDSSEKHTLLSETEPKPSKMLTQYEYDIYLDRIRLGGGKSLVNTCDKPINSLNQTRSDMMCYRICGL